MAKKKEIKLTRTAGETVESGDVNFSYNNVLIGSLSDTGSAVLKTENTVVKHDIEVEYTKPETNYTRTLTVNGNDKFDWALRIPCIVTSIEGEKIAIWRSEANNITVLTGDASTISCIVESVAGPEGSKTLPYNVTGSCVTNYNRSTGKLLLDPNADTFEITIDNK